MRSSIELLSPAGSPDALKAALGAGADAVYFGGGDFNARIGAQNFDTQQLEAGLRLLHLHSRKGYITCNILIKDSELKEVYSFCKLLCNIGADALIVQDVGLARFVREHFPGLPLHASTQMSGHNADMARQLAQWGFTRMVGARELSFEDLRSLCGESPIEIEIFGHGALCVSHSGQCLLSSIIGGRSANRGVCAQPCRLPYSGGYPLSLKDLCVAKDLREFTDCGIASLKIEGRMKSPDYVYRTTRIYRRLIDEKRDAAPAEFAELADIFSRGGFSMGYLKGEISSDMFGIRSEEDKRSTRELAPAEFDSPKKIKICMSAAVSEGAPIAVKAYHGGGTVAVRGDIPIHSETSMNEEKIKAQLTRFGGTPFEVEEFSAVIDGYLSLKKSQLNAVRRDLANELEESVIAANTPVYPDPLAVAASQTVHIARREGFAVAVTNPTQMRAAAMYSANIDRVYVPLERIWEFELLADKTAIVFPRAVFPREYEAVRAQLRYASKLGIKDALLGNIGHLSLAREFGFSIIADYGINLFNSHSAEVLCELGVQAAVVSPELGRSDIAKLNSPIPLMYCAYGYIVGMLLESVKGERTLVDRVGAQFRLIKEQNGRHQLLNSVPVDLADKQSVLSKLQPMLCFTSESADEVGAVMRRFIDGIAPEGKYTRGKNIN